MISLFAILPLQATVTPASLIDRCIAAHNKAKSASVTISYGNKRTLALSFIAPDQARMRIVTPSSGMASSSDRTYTLNKDKVYGWDQGTKEWLVRPVPAKGSMAERFSAAVGQIDQAIGFMLDPHALEIFLKPLRTMPSWRVGKSGSNAALDATITGVGRYHLEFAADGRLAGVRIITDKAAVDWGFRYSAGPSSLKFVKPAGAERAEFFRDRQRLPKFADAASKKTYQSAVRAYERATTLAYSVSDDSGTWKVSFSPHAFTQSGPATFSWINGQLVAVKNGKRVTEKCQAKDLPHRLSKLGVAVEPMLRIVLLGFNPFERLMTGLTLRSAGSISVGGVKFTVIEAEKPGYRLTVQIRSDNNLIGGSVSDQLDARGNSMNRAERRFTYK